jgi:hypothetical protein
VHFYCLDQLLFGFLSRSLCVESVQYAHVPTDGGGIYRERQSADRLHTNAKDARYHDGDDVDLSSSAASQHVGQPMALEQTLEEIRRYLRVLANKPDLYEQQQQQSAMPSHRELVVGEWHQVALIVDRLSFYMFTFITIVCTAAMYHG